MKKVLVLVAAMLLVASGAMASSVVNSAHNLLNIEGGANDNTEVCVYCHTPHNADITVTNAPLWNRTTTTPLTFYNSATLNQTLSRPGIVSAAILASDAPLCLSCHDGASLGDALVNPPNSATTMLDFGAYTMGANANIGTALTDDHPIGMNYVAVQSAVGAGSDEGGFNAAAAGAVNGLNLYAGNKVWCSTCHDVHDDVNSTFLATSNANSDLCLDCHIK